MAERGTDIGQCPQCLGLGYFGGEECFECDGEGRICWNCGEPETYCDCDYCEEDDCDAD